MATNQTPQVRGQLVSLGRNQRAQHKGLDRELKELEEQQELATEGYIAVLADIEEDREQKQARLNRIENLRIRTDWAASVNPLAPATPPAQVNPPAAATEAPPEPVVVVEQTPPNDNTQAVPTVPPPTTTPSTLKGKAKKAFGVDKVVRYFNPKNPKPSTTS